MWPDIDGTGHGAQYAGAEALNALNALVDRWNPSQKGLQRALVKRYTLLK